jgi:hypothetical protein
LILLLFKVDVKHGLRSDDTDKQAVRGMEGATILCFVCVLPTTLNPFVIFGDPF